MNVTCVPRVTMMSFGVATQLLMVIVLVRTAPPGVVDGVVGAGPIVLHAPDELELELGLELELPQAAIAKSAAAVQAAAARRRMLIPTLDLKRARPVTLSRP
jgi:hypothetical protein